MPNHFGIPTSLSQLGERAALVAKSLSDAAGNGPGASKYLPTGAKTVGRFMMPTGARDCIVHIEITRETSPGVVLPNFAMRLEFNPRKLGPNGTEVLLQTFEMVDPPFKFGAFLADARVTRFDVAVDFVGLSPIDVILTAKNEGKRVDYYGPDGALESVQLHRKTKAKSKPVKTLRRPLGPLAVKLYDRNRERKAHGKPPPVEGHACTRVEVVRTKLPNPYRLQDMYGEAPFKGVALSYAPTCSPWLDAKVWPRYLACRRAVGHLRATELLQLSPTEALRADAAYSKHANTLCGDLSLQDWQMGVEEVGLKLLVDLAAKVDGGAGKKQAKG